MKIDFNYKFVDLDGNIIRDGADEREEVDGKMVVTKKAPPFTMRMACVNVLVLTRLDRSTKPKELTGQEKVDRYELAMRIHKSTGLVDLSVEDIVLLKDLVGSTYPPITVGQAWDILDPHDAEKKK